MASKKCSLICVVLFLCIMSFSTMAIARNIREASEVYANEMGQNRKLFVPVPPDQRCKRGRITFEVSIEKPNPSNPESKAQNDPRCHNYL
ncbi:hypothetical protein QL285_018612 [Trifolium repens]|nr:hypothetical protein QL285_018612 [Trifolium repens]